MKEVRKGKGKGEMSRGRKEASKQTWKQKAGRKGDGEK
jgi:hypothetical protein